MSSYSGSALVSSTSHNISGGKTLVAGTAHEITEGKTLMDGTAYTIPFKKEIVGSSLNVGDSVYLNVNGVSTEFIVVHVGNPSTTVYDDSANGVWLMAKDIYINRAMTSDTDADIWPNSPAYNYLNTTFIGLLDSDVQAALKYVNIPFMVDGEILERYDYQQYKDIVDKAACKVFLPSTTEIGGSHRADGALLDYFKSATNATRIAYNSSNKAVNWYTRTLVSLNVYVYVTTAGAMTYNTNSPSTDSRGMRPMLVLPLDTKFNSDFTFNSYTESSSVPDIPVTYTGKYTDQCGVYMDNGIQYRLLTLTGSGTLTVGKNCKCDVWWCGGGTSGVGSTIGRSYAQDMSLAYAGGGGGGGYFDYLSNFTLSSTASYAVLVGAGGPAGNSDEGNVNNVTCNAGSTTSFNGITTKEHTIPSYKNVFDYNYGTMTPGECPATGINGASGGGKGWGGSSAGKGGGVSTRPFNDHFFNPHCSGGTGGTYHSYDTSAESGDDDRYDHGCRGGIDGNDGSDRAAPTNDYSTKFVPTIYGSGGTGAGVYFNWDHQYGGGVSYTSEAGIQGVVYVRIPYNQ